ncbi:MAG: methyltransferase [Clostridiales bacterium]|nr:methyltransferase [Clostridiales bacterium]
MTPLPDEQIDDLQNNGLKILQKKRGFRFGMDSILLKDFVRIKPKEHLADLVTGSAVLPLLLSQKEPTARFSAFERQPDIADMAARSVRYNQLENRITVYCEDLRNAHRVIGKASADAVVCNPPYGKKGGILPSKSENKHMSRHETDCDIYDIVISADEILKNKGRIYVSFPSRRMLELFDCLRSHHLEPKRLRMVCGKASKAPYLLLVEAAKNAKPMLHFLPPLIVLHGDGTETEEIKRIYLRGR